MNNLATREFGIGIAGVGKYLPEELITNQQLEEWTGVKAEAIEAKTGIITRRKAGDSESTSQMSAHAARQALEMAGITADQLGLIITCTFTADYVYPAVSCRIHELIGAKNAGAFDLQANCTGFQVGLSVASSCMQADPTLEYVLVIGAALQSRFINWKDPNSAIFFGDGVGAAVLKKVPGEFGILSNTVLTKGRAYEAVRLRGGGSSHPLRAENIALGLQFYELDGMEVWKQVVQYQPVAIADSLKKIGKTAQDVDFFIFHQANLRLIEFLMGKMKVPMSKTFTNVQTIGNTADASQAIALCDAVQAGCLKRGDLVLISGVGAGFTFGSTVLRWY